MFHQLEENQNFTATFADQAFHLFEICRSNDGRDSFSLRVVRGWVHGQKHQSHGPVTIEEPLKTKLVAAVFACRRKNFVIDQYGP